MDLTGLITQLRVLDPVRAASKSAYVARAPLLRDCSELEDLPRLEEKRDRMFELSRPKLGNCWSSLFIEGYNHF